MRNRIGAALVVLLASPIAGVPAPLAAKQPLPARPLDPNWESLRTYPVPEWFRDAKFGIYTHWGVYAVPAFGSEWYPRNTYRKDSREQKHHVKEFGELSKFGYKDFIPMFKAERFDAEEWAELFAKAGARFAGPVAEHHDGFSMWASKVNRWNAGAMGPKRDITAELVRALRKRNLRIITSFHHAFNIQGYYTAVEGADTADPQYADLYGQFKDPKLAHDRWLAKIQEVIDAYQPDQLWFDFGLGRIPDEYKRRMTAYYYNKSRQWKKGVVITHKRCLPSGVGVLDIERGRENRLVPYLWQTDDSVATNTWGYTQDFRIKPVAELVHELIDIVSKNGVLLLNVGPKADGTIPAEQAALLLGIGKWLKVNGEAIYDTRPWIAFHDAAKPEIRFTAKGGVLYAVTLGLPQGQVRIASLGKSSDMTRGDVKSVRLLGHEGTLTWSRDDDALTITPPEQAPCEHALAFAIAGLTWDPGYTVTVRPGRDGTLSLSADLADLHGSQIRVETKSPKEGPNLGFWDSAGEWASWQVRFAEPGTYEASARCAAASDGIQFVVEAAGQQLAATAPNTGDFARFQTVTLGKLEIAKAGVQQVKIRAKDPSKWKAVNVAWVRLRKQ
jgi:alpha-L-fucosidase